MCICMNVYLCTLFYVPVPETVPENRKNHDVGIFRKYTYTYVVYRCIPAVRTRLHTPCEGTSHIRLKHSRRLQIASRSSIERASPLC